MPFADEQTRFRCELLLHASDPSIPLPNLLYLILEKAVELTGPSVRAGVFSGEPAQAGEEDFFGSIVESTSTPADALRRLRRGPQSEENLSWALYRQGRFYSSTDSKPGSAPEAVPLSAASSLRLALLDGDSLIGVIYVEGARKGCFNGPLGDSLRSLCKAAALAVLRFRMSRFLIGAGHDVRMVGAAASFLEMERRIRQVAAQSAGHVLITGERGSGKELAARAIHAWSCRRRQPFVAALLSGLPRDLVASELFGHERHAFTGAEKRREGKFAAAHQGILLLDEVADLPAFVQTALLRVIERGEIEPLGRDLPLKVDVRVLASTNRDRRNLPEVSQQNGAFSPSTRKFQQRLGWATRGFFERLQAHDWPGNVRQLAALMQRLAAFSDGQILDEKCLLVELASSGARLEESGAHLQVEDLHPQFGKGHASDLSPSTTPRTRVKASDTFHERVNRFEAELLRKALEETGGNYTHAARRLGLSLSTLRDKLRKHGLYSKRKN